MRRIYKEQINDLNSQAYLIHDFFNGLAKHPKFKQNRYNKIKKLQAKDVVAQALHYENWTQLKVHSKSHQPSCKLLQIFESINEATSFFQREFAVSEEFALELAKNLPWRSDESEFDFIGEFCEAFDVRLMPLYDEQYDNYGCYIGDEGDMSVGLFPLDSGLNFWEPSSLNEFLQRHIMIVRSDYLEFDNVDKVFDKLLAAYNKECKENQDKLYTFLSIKAAVTPELVRFLQTEESNQKSKKAAIFGFLEAVRKEYLHCDDISLGKLYEDHKDLLDSAYDAAI